MLDICISCLRHDLDFVRRLFESLEAGDRESRVN